MAKGDPDGEYVVLTDEEGVEHQFEILDVITVDDRDYAILAVPESEEEAFVLRVETDEDGNDVLVDVEDDGEWERVSSAWEEEQDLWDEEDWDEEEDDEVEADEGDED